jgi:hypothetical protein
MFQGASARIRGHIAAHGDEWEAILRDPGFSSRFCVLGGKLQRVPRGYDAAHPQAAEVFCAMQPFSAFLNAAFEGF